MDRVKAVTPVPGGVGPMTIAMLLANTVDAAVAQHKAARGCEGGVPLPQLQPRNRRGQRLL